MHCTGLHFHLNCVALLNYGYALYAQYTMNTAAKRFGCNQPLALWLFPHVTQQRKAATAIKFIENKLH